MSPAILSPGSCGGDSIEFDAHAPFERNQVYKLKICEGRACGKTFTTLEMAPMKLCRECRKRLEVANHAPIPKADVERRNATRIRRNDYPEASRERNRAKSNAWRAAHPERSRAYQAEYMRNRRKIAAKMLSPRVPA